MITCLSSVPVDRSSVPVDRSRVPDDRRRARLAAARQPRPFLARRVASQWLRGVLLPLVLLAGACVPDNAPERTPGTGDSWPSAAELARWEAHAANVEILRDRWGIPHIYGVTDADTVFGTLYAQAEDDFNRVETNYINAMGRLAEAEGEGEFMRDLRMKLFIDPADMRELFAQSPDWLQTLMVAFADGLNYYLHTHPEVQPRVIERFEPWMALTFTEGSIGGDIERVQLDALGDFYNAPGRAAPAVAPADDEPRGSNGFAIAPANTAAGNALLLINPHTSFFFRAELHMVSEQGLNAYGAVTWGQFFIYQGFNENLGWMHTSSRADAIDEYVISVTARDDGYHYRYGEGERPLRATRLSLPYATAGGGRATREYTVYHSHHGPIIRHAAADERLAGAAEGEQWVAIKLMEEPIKALSQSYLRTKAGNHEEFRATMDYLTNSSNNTVYADRDGNIAYYHGNFIPVRDPRFDWNAPLDGSDPATEWQGLHPVDELITLFNPPNGWIQNTNNTPFSAAGDYSPRPEDYPAYMANNPENPRGVHALRVLEGRADFTVDTLLEAAYDPRLTAFEELVPALSQVLADGSADAGQAAIPPRAMEYLDHLRAWDYRWSLDSTATTLAVYWAQRLRSETLAEARAAGVDAYRYMVDGTTPERKLAALVAAAAVLERDFGDWRVPWGEVNRYQRNNGDIVQQFDDGKPSIPVPFASGRWGSLASFGARAYPGTRRMYGTSGNSFVAAVEFGDRLRAKAVTVGGLSSDPQSPHFDDQAQMYADGEFRDVLFYRQDIEANLERSYRPGQ